MTNRCSSPIAIDLDGAMTPAMEAGSSTASFGRYHLFTSCHPLKPDRGHACSTRRTRVSTSPVVVVIKHDANAMSSADKFQLFAAKFVTSSSSMSLSSVVALRLYLAFLLDPGVLPYASFVESVFSVILWPYR